MFRTAGEVLGGLLGALLAPLAALGARLRGGRVLHPDGVVCAAEVVATTDDPALVDLARRLAGGALVRLSGALWREVDAPELLGCALRLRGDRPLTVEVAPQDQDLLFATMRTPWSLPLAMLTTERHDYLHNVYYTVGCLDAERLGPVELRLVPLPQAAIDGSRDERLAAAMSAGHARMRLELCRRGRGSWHTLCELRLRERLELVDPELCFSPYQTGQDLRPRGLLHAMRGPTYRAGQAQRLA
jgi:hypothetical protein